MTVESSNPWEVTPEVIAEAKRVGKLIKERNEKIKSSTAACPIHIGKRGKYSHLTGSFTQVRPVYICPEGKHQFTLQN